jgi:hypothetical protein
MHHAAYCVLLVVQYIIELMGNRERQTLRLSEVLREREKIALDPVLTA